MSAAISPRLIGTLGAAAAGAGVALSLAACSETTVLRHGRRVSVALLEYRLRPHEIVARPGHLTIVVANHGRLTHDLVVLRSRPVRTVTRTPTGPVTSTTTVAARTPDLPPGVSTTLNLTLGPGRYAIASTLENDRSLGAAGTLTVTSK